MLECERLKFEKAEILKQRVKKTCNLSFLHIGINTLNDNVNVELNQKEVSQEVLNTLKNELGNMFQSSYRILPTPILSGTYMDNPVRTSKVLYNFEKI
ncbi:MAG: hypothetical protein KHX03_09565 [Clostridium sp.]|nr:hypothetical protein [Clostridium sp.]